ncbi:hypothetical protein ACRAWD_31570 [Caulobacter segnis]
MAAAPPGEVYGFAGWRLDSASRDLVDAQGQPVSLTGGEARPADGLPAPRPAGAEPRPTAGLDARPQRHHV